MVYDSARSDTTVIDYQRVAIPRRVCDVRLVGGNIDGGFCDSRLPLAASFSFPFQPPSWECL